MISRKKHFLLLLVMVMLGSLLTACNSSSSDSKSIGSSPASSTSTTPGDHVKEIQDGTFKFATPVTISSVMPYDPTYKYKNGETLGNNVHSKWAHDQLGIDINVLSQVPSEQFSTKVRLMLTSGEKLPDVINTEDMSLFNDLISSGKFQDISQAFDKYASPELKKLFTDHPELWSQVTLNGKKMAVPYFQNVANDDGVLWIRQDWLDKLHLKAPSTIEEMESVLNMFLTKNPGNVDHVVPYGIALKGLGAEPLTFNRWFAEGTWLFGPSGTIPEYWLKSPDNTLVYGSIQPGMKDGLSRLRDWYQKGYISKEVGLHDEDKVAELITQGKVGMVVSPYWMTEYPIPDMQKNVPGAVMKPYPLPTINGKAGARDSSYLRGGLLVNKDFKSLDALFLYINRLYAGEDPKPGSEFENGWAEGYSYTKKADGTISTYDVDIPGGYIEVEKYFLFEPRQPYLSIQTVAKFADKIPPQTAREKKAALSPHPDIFLAGKFVNVGFQKGVYIANQFSGSNTTSMQSKNAILDKMENETFLKIIYGTASLDEFDNFVKQWKSTGGDQITQEVNNWYKQNH